MSQLTLTSSVERPLRPLVEAALANEVRGIESAIRRTEERLREFESRYGMSTPEFLLRFERNEIDESLELDEWVGEHRMLERLVEKCEALKGIRFEN